MKMKPMQSTISAGRVTLALLLLVTLAGCSVLPERETVVINEYILPVSLPADSGKPSASLSGSLLIARPEAAKVCATPRMGYRQAPEEIRYYARSRWVDEPAHLLVAAFQTALENQGAFDAVVPQGTPVSTDWRLEFELLSFVQDYTDNSFRISARIRLLNLIERRVVATRLFEIREPVETADVDGGIQAAARASSSLTAQVTTFIARAASGEGR